MSAVESLAPPAYAPSFGAIVKVLGAVEERLAGIEAHPALGSCARRGVFLRDGADAMTREREHLAAIVGEARTREAQRRALFWALGVGARPASRFIR